MFLAIKGMYLFLLAPSVTEQLGKGIYRYHILDYMDIALQHHLTFVLPTFGANQVDLRGNIQFLDLFDNQSLPEGLQFLEWLQFVPVLQKLQSLSYDLLI
jgi:hypothetical protein